VAKWRNISKSIISAVNALVCAKENGNRNQAGGSVRNISETCGMSMKRKAAYKT